MSTFVPNSLKPNVWIIDGLYLCNTRLKQDIDWLHKTVRREGTRWEEIEVFISTQIFSILLSKAYLYVWVVEDILTTFTLSNNYLITIIIYIIKGHFWFSATKQQPINSEWKFNSFAFRQNPDICECWKVFCLEWMGSFMVFSFRSIKSIYLKHLPRKYLKNIFHSYHWGALEQHR